MLLVLLLLLWIFSLTSRLMSSWSVFHPEDARSHQKSSSIVFYYSQCPLAWSTASLSTHTNLVSLHPKHCCHLPGQTWSTCQSHCSVASLVAPFDSWNRWRSLSPTSLSLPSPDSTPVSSWYPFAMSPSVGNCSIVNCSFGFEMRNDAPILLAHSCSVAYRSRHWHARPRSRSWAPHQGTPTDFVSWGWVLAAQSFLYKFTHRGL